jgi:OOP family OmpA-OmpF porin
MHKLRWLMTVLLLVGAASGDALGQGPGWRAGYYGYGGGYRGWYGPGVGVYVGAPLGWGVYPYPYPYYRYPGYYAPPALYPYPVYASPPPMVYIQRPPVVAAAPSPPPPKPRAPAPAFERYTLSARELFAFDSAGLVTPQPKLDEIAAALRRNPQIGGITITGYTDRLGSDAYNLRLSQQRADAEKSYLVGKGVAAVRMIAVGKGKADPLVSCDDTVRARLIACLEPNRRVEIAPFTVERPFG